MLIPKVNVHSNVKMMDHATKLELKMILTGSVVVRKDSLDTIVLFNAGSQCSDGLDNNGNGLTDCLDPACCSDSSCTNTKHCAIT